MIRIKRNLNNLSISKKGYIAKYFGQDLRRILAPGLKSFQNIEIPYVSHQEAEIELSDILVADPEMDKSRLFTGLCGSGKSTIIQHVFCIEDNTNKAHIRDDSIVIPIDFNRNQNTPEKTIVSNLKAAVEEICEKFSIIYPDSTNEDFFKFILNTRRDYFTSSFNYTSNVAFSEKIRFFESSMPIPYTSCQLQFVMEHIDCPLKLVIFIIDNIESNISKAENTKDKYLAPIIYAFKLAECISQRDSNKMWSFNMIIACRHHIWRIMKGYVTDNTQENALLQSYMTTDIPYDLRNPVRIEQIVDKRNEVLSNRQKNKDTWDTAVKVVRTVLGKMDHHIGDFILQIELKDIRKAMNTMYNLIINKSLQRLSDDEILGNFKIDSVEQFDLTRVNLIRTLGYGNLRYYANTEKMPNLLYNEKEEGFELFILLTLKYFLERCSYSEPAWDNKVCISEFYDNLSLCFGNIFGSLKRKFNEAVKFLIKSRLLLRSADEPQNEYTGLTYAEIQKVEFVYVSGKAITLWNELGQSSALFQLYLDDIWLEKDNPILTREKIDIEDCLDYLHYLFKVEKIIFNKTRNISTNCSEKYLRFFGRSSLCAQLSHGLISSLHVIICSDDIYYEMRRAEAQKTLMNAEQLNNEIITWEDTRLNF